MAEKDRRAILATLLELARARERRRIADGLHDDVGQVLAMARAKLGALRASQAGDGSQETPASRRSEPTEPGARDTVADACHLLDRAIASMRSLTSELASPSHEARSLSSELEGLGREIAEGNGIRFRLRGGPAARDLPRDAAQLAVRSVRELLINVLKHARAGNVSLELSRQGDRVIVTVRDDGHGFDPSRSGSESGRIGGLGLARMREQVRGLGGQFLVRSAPGHGTRVSLSLPAGAGAGPSGRKTGSKPGTGKEAGPVGRPGTGIGAPTTAARRDREGGSSSGVEA